MSDKYLLSYRMEKAYIYEGEVIGVFIGVTESGVSEKRSKIELTWEGVKGDRHYGQTKLAGVREDYLPKGTELLNLRQLSIVSVEELRLIEKDLGIGEITPEDLDANLLIKGIENFTRFPFGSIMQFEHCANILLTGDNYPCVHPGQAIDARMGTKIFHTFAKTAMHKRGQTGIVLRPGIIKPNSKFKLIIPKEAR